MRARNVGLCLSVALIGCGGRASYDEGLTAGGSGGVESHTSGGAANGAASASGGVSTAGTAPVSGAGGVSVSTDFSNCARQLASGTDHLCILADNGVSCLGDNSLGQLGNGSNVPSLTPSRVAVGALSLAAGGGHTCVYGGEGVFFCWGDGRHGELGANPTSLRPVRLAENPSSELVLGDRLTCWVGSTLRCMGTEPGATAPGSFELALTDNSPASLVLGGDVMRLLRRGRLTDQPREGAAGRVIEGAARGVLQNLVSADLDCILKAGGTVWCRGALLPSFYAVRTDFGRDIAESASATAFSARATRPVGCSAPVEIIADSSVEGRSPPIRGSTLPNPLFRSRARNNNRQRQRSSPSPGTTPARAWPTAPSLVGARSDFRAHSPRRPS